MIREYSLVFTWVFGIVLLHVLLLRAHASYTHAWDGREKATSVLLASCVNAMAELMELVGNSGWKERSREKVMGEERRARGCS